MSQLVLKGVIISFNYESGMVAKKDPLFPLRCARNTTLINNDGKRKYAKKKSFLLDPFSSPTLHNYYTFKIMELFSSLNYLAFPEFYRTACINDEDTRS